MANELMDLCMSYARPENIHFFHDPEYYPGTCQSEDSALAKKGEIEINTAFPKKKHIVTVMHEVLHMHPRFTDFIKYHKEFNQYCCRNQISESETKKFGELYEKYVKIDCEITRFARQILRTRPDILRFICKSLNEAYILDEKREKEHQEAFDRGDLPF